MPLQQTQPLPAGASAYQSNPSPQSGAGLFGGVPGAVGLPDPYADLARVFPNLSNANAALSGDIASNLSGQISPAVLQQIQSAAGNAGIDTAGLNLTDPYSVLGASPEALQSQGLSQITSTLPKVSSAETLSPGIQAQVSEFNAQNAAKANPTESGLAGIGGSAIGAILAALL